MPLHKLSEDKMRKMVFFCLGVCKRLYGRDAIPVGFWAMDKYQHIGVWVSRVKGIANGSGCWSVACVCCWYRGENTGNEAGEMEQQG